ncbi:keratin, type I cytoskeletal 9-like [Cyclopterus lumpus]|uniref:keratin, type I cytoskeletal 9-like n=1 Tax=Cyclopterus lumpus TaxID=8103 RepID=UPI0014866770|nr:keratin, type I cytoskeletal 9-like [Cyclopterus lumpus]
MPPKKQLQPQHKKHKQDQHQKQKPCTADSSECKGSGGGRLDGGSGGGGSGGLGGSGGRRTRSGSGSGEGSSRFTDSSRGRHFTCKRRNIDGGGRGCSEERSGSSTRGIAGGNTSVGGDIANIGRSGSGSYKSSRGGEHRGGGSGGGGSGAFFEFSGGYTFRGENRRRRGGHRHRRSGSRPTKVIVGQLHNGSREWVHTRGTECGELGEGNGNYGANYPAGSRGAAELDLQHDGREGGGDGIGGGGGGGGIDGVHED